MSCMNVVGITALNFLCFDRIESFLKTSIILSGCPYLCVAFVCECVCACVHVLERAALCVYVCMRAVVRGAGLSYREDVCLYA